MEINARDIHLKYNVGKDFSSWIKGKISKYRLIEGIDYNKLLVNKGKKQNRGRNKLEYLLTDRSSKLIIEGEIHRLTIHPSNKRQTVALDTIEQLLGITLNREYFIGGYRIDGYDVVNNVAYEIDEEQHKYQETKDLLREEVIRNILGCTFVRIKV